MYPLGVLFGAGFDTSSGMLIPISCMDLDTHVLHLVSWLVVCSACYEVQMLKRR